MIFAWLTHDEAVHLRDTCAWPSLREKLQRQLDIDLIPYNEEPRTVILRDEGDGVTLSAVCYDNDKAADRAFEAAYHQLQYGVSEDPPTPRRRARSRP